MTDEQLTGMTRPLGKCIRCDTQIVSMGESMPHNPDGAMWGAVGGSYGSRHDLSTMKVYVCDQCVDAIKAATPEVFDDPTQSFVTATE